MKCLHKESTCINRQLNTTKLGHLTSFTSHLSLAAHICTRPCQRDLPWSSYLEYLIVSSSIRYILERLPPDIALQIASNLTFQHCTSILGVSFLVSYGCLLDLGIDDNGDTIRLIHDWRVRVASLLKNDRCHNCMLGLPWDHSCWSYTICMSPGWDVSTACICRRRHIQIQIPLAWFLWQKLVADWMDGLPRCSTTYSTTYPIPLSVVMVWWSLVLDCNPCYEPLITGGHVAPLKPWRLYCNINTRSISLSWHMDPCTTSTMTRSGFVSIKSAQYTCMHQHAVLLLLPSPI